MFVDTFEGQYHQMKVMKFLLLFIVLHFSNVRG